jgi:pimeloyl-ACP methyl ester carboxylesterase
MTLRRPMRDVLFMQTLPVHADTPDALASTAPAWLDRSLYPFTPRSLATSDGTLSYLDEGRGRVIVFVHGTPSWSFEWRNVILALSKTHRCIAPDHLGFGLSSKPRPGAPLTPEDHARRLGTLFEALDLRDVTLVMDDFGGPIGMKVALDMPERIARLLVINSFMWPNGDDPAVARLDRVIRSFVGRILYRWLNFSARVLLPASFGDKRKLTPAIHRHYLGPFGARRDREGPYGMACALVGADPFHALLWERRAELAAKPMAIVWGEKDPAFRAQHLARWTSAFPDAAIIRVPDAGHFVAEERPDVVTEAVRSLLGARPT